MNERSKIPKPTLRRLPRYYFFLKSINRLGQAYVSSGEIADQLLMEDTLVRKDLSQNGFSGKPKVGYSVSALIAHIENLLGLNNTKDAILVGMGNLGKALAGYAGFSEFGLKITAVFDSDPQKIGKKFGDLIIEDVKLLEDRAAELKSHLGIITVPPEVAQEVCDILVESGVIAIWNFAPIHLNIQQHVIIQNENLAASLSRLSHQILTVVYDK